MKMYVLRYNKYNMRWFYVPGSIMDYGITTNPYTAFKFPSIVGARTCLDKIESNEKWEIVELDEAVAQEKISHNHVTSLWKSGNRIL